MGGLTPEYLNRLTQGIGGTASSFLSQQQRNKRDEQAQQFQAEQTTERQQFATSEREAGQDFRSEESEKNRLLKLMLAGGTGASKPTTLAKQQEKTNIQFEKVKNLMRNLFERKTESLTETKGAGIIKGTLGQIAGAAKIKGFESTAAYEGQRTETALALNSILTGQNRVIKSIVDKILNTLPDIRDTESFTKAKIKQSLINSYGIVRAVQQAGIDFNQYTDEALADPKSNINKQIAALSPKSLSLQEKKDIDALTQSIFGTGPTGVNAKDKDGWQTINGIRIRRKGR